MSKKPSPPAPVPKARGVQKLFGRKSLAFGTQRVRGTLSALE